MEHVRHRLAARIALMMMMLLLLANFDALADSRCGPFGDSPARVDRGWFARVVGSPKSLCFGGALLGPWADANGDGRYACLYEPAWVDEREPLPLLVFLHPSQASANAVVLTGLLKRMDKSSLKEGHPGFILLAPQGRSTRHLYPGNDSNALGWDNWYRQLSPTGPVAAEGATYDENADAASIDHFVGQVINRRRVDPRRIYLMGWSNGAAMALLYALNRRWVAAAAVYSAPDPFAAFFDVCAQTPVAVTPAGDGQARVFNSQVPLMHVRNDCDIEGICPNGSRFATRVRALGGSIDDVITDSRGLRVASCDDSCGTDEMAGGEIGTVAGLRGMARHSRWPDQWNELMLNFLRLHPLGAANDPVEEEHANPFSPWQNSD
jgi:predicted esterase